jgi:hypothetical protein
MAAAPRMSDLAERKRLIVARADLHRQLLALERLRLQGRLASARGFVGHHRWWLLGGAAAIGLLLTRRGRGLAGWMPAVLAVWKALKR